MKAVKAFGDSKIFVAGHKGMVGSALVRTLKRAGYVNLSLKSREEYDLRIQSDVEKLFALERPDIVFLSAAKVGGIYANCSFQGQFIFDNLMIASNVIQASKKYNVQKLINLGSSCVYPRDTRQPISESSLLDGPLEKTNEPYAIAKIAAIKLCEAYMNEYGSNFYSVMPPNLYGDNDNYDLMQSHVLAAFIRKFELAKLLAKGQWSQIRDDISCYPFALSEGGKYCSVTSLGNKTIEKLLRAQGIEAARVTLWGTGSPIREFMFVDDLAAALLFLMEDHNAEDVGNLINVGTGKSIVLHDLAKLVAKTIGFSGAISWNSKMPDGTPKKELDVSRMKDLGWNSVTPLSEGISRTYNNYVALRSVPLDTRPYLSSSRTISSSSI